MRCREGDVDSTGDQHHEQPERKNAHERIGCQQVKKVLHRQELGVRHPRLAQSTRMTISNQNSWLAETC